MSSSNLYFLIIFPILVILKSFSFVELVLNKIPISDHMRFYIKKIKKKILKVISHGEDYQILFTANKNKRNLIKKISGETHTKVSIVGIIKKKSLRDNLKIFKYPGYIHKF